MKIVFALVLLALATCSLAVVPQQVNYQGYLKSPAGAPMDTTVAMTFKLDTDAAGGTLLWTETRAAVGVTKGLCNVRLGELTPLTDAILNNPQIWLGVTVGSNSEMTPRTRVLTVGYAYRVGTRMRGRPTRRWPRASSTTSSATRKRPCRISSRP